MTGDLLVVVASIGALFVLWPPLGIGMLVATVIGVISARAGSDDDAV